MNAPVSVAAKARLSPIQTSAFNVGEIICIAEFSIEIFLPSLAVSLVLLSITFTSTE